MLPMDLEMIFNKTNDAISIVRYENRVPLCQKQCGTSTPSGYDNISGMTPVQIWERK